MLKDFGASLSTSKHRMSTEKGPNGLLDLSGSVAPRALMLADMPMSVWNQPDSLRSEFSRVARQFFECEAVLAVTGIESGISGLARLFQTWYGSMRVVLAEPCFDQWDLRFRRASHIVLDWSVDEILQGEIPDCDVVVLGRPVNPTGELVSIEVAMKLAHRLRGEGGWLILDEAYIDALDVESYCSFIEETPAIVLRSMAPFSGLTGANLAFVCSTRKVCQALLEEVGTQAVSAAQWWLALKYFDAELWQEGQRKNLRAACKKLLAILSSYLGPDLELQEGSYFVTLTGPACVELANKLENSGVLVKLYRGEESNLMRVGLPRTEADWVGLEEALQKIAS